MGYPVVFQNKRFIVQVVAIIDEYELVSVAGAVFHSVYYVTNIETGVVEVKTPGLVEAMMYAENCDRMLEQRPWEWARQSEQEAAGATIEHDGPVN